MKAILSFLFLGILCSLVNRAPISDLSKAEVNAEFGDCGDSITATATIRVEAPVDDQATDETFVEHPYDIFEAFTKIIPNTIKDVSPEAFIPNSLPIVIPEVIPDVLPNIYTHFLPKCCHGSEIDCSWLEHMVVVVCKFREDAWNMIVKILLHIRDAFNFLAYLLSSISSLIYIDCNTSSNHWDGCSSNLLRDVLDWLYEKYKIVLSWIPESENLPTTGLSMIQKILISFDTVLGYFIIILGIFFEKQTQKNKIIQKIKDVLGDSSADTLSYS